MRLDFQEQRRVGAAVEALPEFIGRVQEDGLGTMDPDDCRGLCLGGQLARADERGDIVMAARAVELGESNPPIKVRAALLQRDDLFAAIAGQQQREIDICREPHERGANGAVREFEAFGAIDDEDDAIGRGHGFVANRLKNDLVGGSPGAAG